ncbi:MAG: hypothetical protein KJZ55_07645, partial [Flavobacteriales bacterium]|nr:hypothetical protein [Flavobacteriales bacterium]
MKNLYKKILLSASTFMLTLSFTNTFGQGATCASADPFCTGSTYTFPNSTGTSSESGNNYDCLDTQPNPAWYYMEIATGGNMDISISQVNGSGSGIDVDFILYGPYSD